MLEDLFSRLYKMLTEAYDKEILFERCLLLEGRQVTCVRLKRGGYFSLKDLYDSEDTKERLFLVLRKIKKNTRATATYLSKKRTHLLLKKDSSSTDSAPAAATQDI